MPEFIFTMHNVRKTLGDKLILDNVTRGRQEARRMAYLAIPAWEPPATPPAPPTRG